MKQKFFSSALKGIVPWVLAVLLPATAAAYNYQGSGTPDDPYLITDYNGLVDAVGQVGKHFRLEADINIRGWNKQSTTLKSTIDGNGHTLTGYQSTSPIFSKLSAGTTNRGVLRNLNISGAIVNNNSGTEQPASIIVGVNEGSIINCHIKGNSKVYGKKMVAAIARESKGIIDSCGVWAGTEIKGIEHVGGLVAKLNNGTVRRSFFNGTINANASSASEAHGEYGSDGVASIVGLLWRGTVDWCTAAGTINTNMSCVGGLVGRIYYKNAHITNNFSATNIVFASTNIYGSSVGGAPYMFYGQLVAYEPTSYSEEDNILEYKNNHVWKVSDAPHGVSGKIHSIGFKSTYGSYSDSSKAKEYDSVNTLSIKDEAKGKIFFMQNLVSPAFFTEEKLYATSTISFFAYYNGSDAVLKSIKMTKSGSDDIIKERGGSYDAISILSGDVPDGYELSEIATISTKGDTWHLDLYTQTLYAEADANGNVSFDTELQYVVKHAKLTAKGTKVSSGLRICSYLEDVTFPEGLLTIGEDFLSYCGYLTKVQLPSTLQRIESEAFRSCVRLTEVQLPASLQIMEARAFCTCSSLTKVEIPANSALNDIGKTAFSDCTSLKEIKLPASLTYIGDYSFKNCSSLEKIDFGNTQVKVIDVETFSGCKVLNEVVLPHALETIGVDAFKDCPALSEIVFPASLKSIGKRAFIPSNSGDSPLTNITFMYTDTPASLDIDITALHTKKDLEVHTQNARIANLLSQRLAFSENQTPNVQFSWKDNSQYAEGRMQVSSEDDMHNFIAYIYYGKKPNIKADLLKDFDMRNFLAPSKPFTGQLDGKGHTLKLNKPLFESINGVTICNVKLEGTINGGETTNIGSLARTASGTNTLHHLTSEVNLSSSVNGAAYYGGLIGKVEGGTTTIENSLYKGAMTGLKASKDGDPATTYFGGMVGQNAGTLSLTSCLTQPDSVSINNYYATFAYGTAPTLTNCYFFNNTINLGKSDIEEQGTVVGVNMTTDDLVGYLGDQWAVDVNDDASLKVFSDAGWTGTGDEDHPFVISNKESLQLFITKLSKGNEFSGQYVELANDLDLSGVNMESYSKDFDSSNSGFKGIFDGKKHTIKNFTINQPEKSYLGLIRKLDEGGVVKDLFMENPTISGSNYVGTLVGYATKGNVEGCVVKGATINIARSFGGILLGYTPTANLTLTQNFYYNAKSDTKGVGTSSTASEDKVGAEKGLFLERGDNISAMAPTNASDGMLALTDGRLLVPTRLQSFLLTLTLDIIDTQANTVTYGADGGNMVTEGADYRVTPAADNNGTVKIWVRYVNNWARGNGSAGSPWEISNATDLLTLVRKVNVDGETYADKYFKLTNNIDMTEVSDFMPIGYGENKEFAGTLKGNNKTITGLHFADAESSQGIGLFGNLTGTAEGIILVRPEFEGQDYVGAIAGKATGATVKNNFVIDATITATGDNKGLFVGASTAVLSDFTTNRYHRLANDVTALIGSTPETDAQVMHSITPAEKITISNIDAANKQVVADITYCPYTDTEEGTVVTLDIDYADANTNLKWQGRFTDGNTTVLTQLDDNRWYWNMVADMDVVISPDTATYAGSCASDTTSTAYYRYDPLNHTLYINGVGAIADYVKVKKLPWYAIRSQIKTVLIGEGITKVGNLNFSGCTALETVELPSTLTSIGTSAFEANSAMTKITLPAKVSNIGNKAFYSCSNLKSIAMPVCTTVPTFGSDVLKSTTNAQFHVLNSLVPDFKSAIGTYATQIAGFTYPADAVTVTATVDDSIHISSEGVTPAIVSVKAVIKQPVTVTFNASVNHSYTFDEFSEENPVTIMQADGISTKPATGETSVIVDNGNYALDFYGMRVVEYNGINYYYDNYYDDDLGVVYANNYKVTLTPQADKYTLIGETTSKDGCEHFYVGKETQGLYAFSIDRDEDDSDHVTFVASVEPVVVRDTTYYPMGTQFDLTYTLKKANEPGYDEYYDRAFTDDEFAAFRAIKYNYSSLGLLWYDLSSAEIEYNDAKHSTLWLGNDDTHVIATRMNKIGDQCDIIPEKGEVFFHTSEPGGFSSRDGMPGDDDFHYFSNHSNGNTRWDKVGAFTKTVYFDEQIKSIPDGCFDYMPNLNEVYFFGNNVPLIHGGRVQFYGGSGIAIGSEQYIYVPEKALTTWPEDTWFSRATHGELTAIPAMTIEGMDVALTVNGEPCTLYKAANPETGEAEVQGGTYHITYNGHSAREQVIPVLMDGGAELDDTENYSLRAFNVDDVDDTEGTDIYKLKDAGTYRLKIIGTRFHKGTFDLCNLVIDKAPFESITYETLPDRHLYLDEPITFEYGWMDDDFNYLYDSPFIFNGEPLEVYHYGSGYGYGTYGDDEFYLIYTDNDHPGKAKLTLKSRNRNFTDGEHTLFYTLTGEEYSGAWGNLVWDISKEGVLTIKPAEGVTSAPMLEAGPDPIDNDRFRGYPWFQIVTEEEETNYYTGETYTSYSKFEIFNTYTTINICEGVTSIAADAFYCDYDYPKARYKALNTINVAASVQTIGENAFNSYYVKNIVFAHTNGLPTLSESNVFPDIDNLHGYDQPKRGDYLIWVDGSLYNNATTTDVWKDYKDHIVPEYVDIPVGEAGMRTFSHRFPLDFTQTKDHEGQPASLKAYVATSGIDKEEAEITFNSITEVPASTGLLLKGEKGSYRVPTRMTDEVVQNNLLKAVIKDTKVDPTDSEFDDDNHKWVYYTNFILAQGNNNGPIGFYPLDGAGTITANKAYLQLRNDQVPEESGGNGSTTSRGIRFIFDDGDNTQDIEAPETAIREYTTDVWYDLSGHRLSDKPTRGGLYIHNGKKVVIK